MKKYATLTLAVVCALQAAVIAYLLIFTKPLTKVGGWWVFRSQKDEILKWEIPETNSWMLIRSFPGLSDATFFIPSGKGMRSINVIPKGNSVSTMNSWKDKEGVTIIVSDKDGDGLAEQRGIKIGEGAFTRSTLTLNEQK